MSRMMDVRPVHRTPIRQALPTIKVEKRKKRIELRLSLPRLRFKNFSLRKPMHAAVTLILLASIVGPTWDAIATAAKYRLTPQALSLAATPASKLLSQLNYDKAAKAYVISTDTNNNAGQSTQVGGSGYKASFPSAAAQGVTIQDNSTNLSLSFTPQFSQLDAKLEDGHVVYPGDSKPLQTLYTVKANGVKEDVVLEHAVGDSLSFSYRLDLPQTLEAKLLPGGAVGIYSADPTLFGNIQTGSSSDQQTLENARANSDKNHLAFVIPAPTIKQAPGNQGSPTAKFGLSGNVLTVTANGLAHASYPLSIDPSFIVTSVSDFQNGNNEDNINFDSTNNQISRAGITAGTTGAWVENNGSTTSLPSATVQQWASAIYNGYYYVTAGATMYYASIAANGTVNALTTASNSPATGNASDGGFLAYNGYLYRMGGETSSLGTTTSIADVEYAKIQSNGDLGVWQTTSSLQTASGQSHPGGFRSHAVAYNGRIYYIGGCTTWTSTGGCSGFVDAVQWTTINPNGSLAAWTVTAGNTSTGYAYTTARWGAASEVYNGVLYIEGGAGSSGNLTDVQYSQIQSNGAPGQWATSSVTLPQSVLNSPGAIAVNGYIYLIGGTYAGGPGSNIYYAQINADGSIGSFILSPNSFLNPAPGNGRTNILWATSYFNGRLYIAGGDYTNSGGGDYQDIQLASIDPAYTLRGTIADGSLPTPVWGGQTLVFNGFIYVFGGCTAAPTYVAGALQPCPAANIIGHGGDSGHAQGTSGDRLTIQFAHLAADGSIDTGYTISGYTSTNGWFTDKSTCTEAGLLKPDACPGSRYAFAGIFHGGHFWVISGRGGDSNGTSGQNNLTADANIVYFNSNGTPGSWQTGSNTGTNCGPGNGLNTAREFASAALSENFWHDIYVIGGRDTSGNVLSSMEYGGLNYGGTNGCDWNNSSVSLPNGRWQTSVVSYDGDFYVIGGRGSGSTVYSDIQQVNVVNGSISSVTTACSSCGLPSIYGASAFANKGELYVIGGVTNGTDPPSAYSSTIYQASISSSGSIGTFTTASATLSAGSYQGSVTYDAWHDTFYAIGGANGSGMVSAVQYEPLNLGGSGNLTWSSSSSDTGVQRAAMGVAQYKNFVYLVGGYNGSYLNTVQMGTINQDGTITWSSSESNTIPVTMAYNGAFVADGYLYAVGGREDDTNASDVTNEIYRAPIDPSTGHLSGAFAPIATLNMPLEGFATAVYNNYLYVIDGRGWPGGTETAEFSYEYAAINTDGSLGSFTTAATGGNVAALFGVNASVGPGGIYLGDGSLTGCVTCTGNLTYAQFTAQGVVASVNANHTLTFTQDGGPDAYGIEQTRVVYDGVAYALGGGLQQGGTASAVTSTSLASVLSGPGISQQSWAQVSNMPVARTWHAAFAYNGRVYVVGGCQDTTSTTEGTASLVRVICSGTYLSTENHASVASVPRVAHYSKLLDSDLDVAPTKLVTNGSLADVSESTASLSYQTSTSTGNSWSSPQTPALTLGAPLTITADTGGLDRYYWLWFTLDDTQAATFPDTSTALTDFTLYIHPNPGRRLRGGATFTGGSCNGSTAAPPAGGNCGLDASP